MNAQQIQFGFCKARRRRTMSNKDLIGRSYPENEHVTVQVIGAGEGLNGRAILRRDPGGTISLPVWLVRAILKEGKKEGRRAA